MRIVHLCSTLGVEAGGLSRAVLDSVDALIRAGAEVDLIAYAGGTPDFPWKDAAPPSLHLHIVDRPPNIHIASSAIKAALVKALTTADVLHIHGMWEPLSASAANQARAADIPYVCSVHGMLDPWSVRQRYWKKWLYFNMVERRRLRHAAVIHFTAAQEAKKARRWLPRGARESVIPCILDLSPYQDLPARAAAHAIFPGVNPDAPWVLFLSRIHEKKGLDLLLQAIAKLADTSAELLVAGSGDETYTHKMKALAETLGISARTHFVGMVSGTKKVALLRRANMLVIPTSQENFGLVFPEALCCETPVLLTEGVDIHQEILEADAGLLIRRDPLHIAAQIEWLLHRPEEALRRGRQGRSWVLRSLDPSLIARRWMETYQNLAADQAPSTRDKLDREPASH